MKKLTEEMEKAARAIAESYRHTDKEHYSVPYAVRIKFGYEAYCEIAARAMEIYNEGRKGGKA